MFNFFFKFFGYFGKLLRFLQCSSKKSKLINFVYYYFYLDVHASSLQVSLRVLSWLGCALHQKLRSQKEDRAFLKQLNEGIIQSAFHESSRYAYWLG